MAEQQLQLGELEQLNGQGQPIAPAAPVVLDEEAQAESVQDFEAEDSEFVSPLASGPIMPLAIEHEDISLQPSSEKLEQTAALINTAMPEAFITPESVAEMLQANYTSADADALWQQTQGLDEEERKGIVAAAINNPNLQMDAKLNLIRKAVGGVPDPTVIEKAALRNQLVNEQDDLEDSPEFLAASTEFIRAINGNLDPFSDKASGPKEQQVASYIDEIRNLYTEADENLGFLDFAEQFTPGGSLPTLNKVVSRIYNDLGLTTSNADGRPWVALGNTLLELRTMYQRARPHEKERIAGVVLKHLHSNSGLFQDTNDLVTMHVLSNIFSKEITGEEFRGGADIEMTEEERANLPKRIARIEAEFKAAKGTPRRQELQRELEVLKLREHRIPGMSQLADNVFNLLDWVGVGGLARGTLSLGSKVLGRGLKNTARATPNLATNQLADAIGDSLAADRLGVTQTQAVEAFLTRGVDEAFDGVNGLSMLNARQVDATETLLRMQKPSNLTGAEQAKALQELGQEVAMLINKPRPSTHVNLSRITPTPDGNGAEIEMLFGANATRGYATIRSARNASKVAVEDVFGKDAPIEIVRKNEATGAFEVVSPALPDRTTGPFFLRVKETRAYDTLPQTYGAIQFADDAVADLSAGVTGSEFLTGLNVFDKFTYNLVSSRVREWRAAQGAFRGQLRAISDLGPKKQQLLSKIIKENEGVVLGERELMQLTGNDRKMVEGYKAFRHVADTMYTMADRHLRSLYLREGMQDIHVDGVRVGWGKPVMPNVSQLNSGKWAFDPLTGQHARLSAAAIKKIYAEGGSLVHMRYPIGDSRLVVLTKGKNRVLPLPHKGVLPKIEGYYPHITQGNYYAVGVLADGTKHAIGVAHTKTDLMNYIARRQAKMAQRAAQGKKSRFVRIEARDAPEMTTLDEWAASMDEIYTMHGGPVYGKREGGSLHNLSKSFGATELDPVAALVRGTEIVSASVTKGELISSMRQRLYNFLQRKPGLFVNPQTLAKDLTEANISTSFSNIRDVDTARRYLRQIELMQNTPDAWRQLTKATYRRMAHYAYELTTRGILGKNVGKKLQQELADRARTGIDPAGQYMGWLHRVYVAAMAPKQFVLQGAQSLVAASYSPAGYAKALRQFFPVGTAVLNRLASLHGGKGIFKGMPKQQMEAAFPELAKIAGMSIKEFEHVVDAIVQRGLVDSVAHNTMIKDAIGEAAERAMKKGTAGDIGGEAGRTIGRVARALDRNTFGAASKIGFEGGENINQILTFLTVHNKLGGNLAKASYIDEVVGATAHITGNMVKEASARYTRSFVKPLFQWVPFQHKMVLMTMPNRMGGSKMLTGDEKARMALTQFLLFGSKSTAIAFATHEAIERLIVEKLEAQPEGDANAFVQMWRNPTTKNLMEGLVFDTLANSVMKALWGKENENWTEFDMSKSFAPGAGVEFLGERLTAIFSLDKENFFGAQGKYASGIWDFADTVRGVAQAQLAKADTVPFNERAQLVLNRGAMAMLPAYGRFLTARWAIAHDGYISEGGQLSEGISTEIEGQMYAILGVDTKDRASYYEARDRLEGQFAEQEGVDRELRNIADTYWKNLVLYSVKLNQEAPTDEIYNNLLNEHVRNQGLLFSVLDPADGEKVNEIITRKLENVMKGNGDSAEKLFVERITQKLSKGDFGSKGPQAAVYLRNLPFVQNNPERLQMVNDAFEEVVYGPTPQNVSAGTLEDEVENGSP